MTRIAEVLLEWYDAHHRSFPFRGTRDPYRVWISEIMLQQTRTETVGAYYTRFLERFPNVHSLADAPEQEVLKAWEGLGYYSRARNLHNAARIICTGMNGVFPGSAKALRELPGIGAYTAAAIASIAYDEPVPALDGNLIRVFCRLGNVLDCADEPSVRTALEKTASEQMPPVRCGDFNQALMDLGATVCLPGRPVCERCPLSGLCLAHREGDPASLPRKKPKAAPKEEHLNVYLFLRDDGRIAVTRRKEGLLRSMALFPTSPVSAQEEESGTVLGSARHVFTHRIWEMTIRSALLPEGADTFSGQELLWVTRKELEALPFPAAMREALRLAKELPEL